VATPSVRTGLTQVIYLTLLKPSSAADDHVTFGVRLMPMTVWLWVGGLLVATGTVLAAFPGRRRRRPTDPVSAPIRVDAGSTPVPEADAPDLIGVPRGGRRLGAADV
jgi:cytochrome c-type biogenesis protein CcmF